MSGIWPPVVVPPPPVAGVTSFNARTGAVLPASGDYAASKVSNDSSVPGADVKAALNALLAAAYPPVGFTTQTIWNPDAPPAVPSIWDDECDGAVIDAKWSVWDPAVYQTRTAHPTEGGFYIIRGTGNGTDRWGGLYQAKPAAEFCFAAKIGFYGSINRYLHTGLLVTPNIVANPATASFQEGGMYLADSTEQGSGFTMSWANYTTAGTPRGSYPNIANAGLYVIGRVKNDTVAWDVSHSGLAGDWINLSSDVSVASLTHFGWGMDNLNATSRACTLQWFRVLGTGAGSSDFGALHPGRNQQILVGP